jgi:hypothetical protein
MQAKSDQIQPMVSTVQSPTLLQFPDGRALAISAFLDKHGCGTSLEDLNIATVFVTEADKNNISPFILPAIWIAESTCGKHQLVNNGFGFMKPGGQSAGLRPFKSTNDAISYISHALTIHPYAKSSPQADVSVYNGNPSYLVEFNALYAQQVAYKEGYAKLMPMVANNQLEAQN